MDNYFEAIENLEKELYFLSTGEKQFYKCSYYWNNRNIIIGKMENIFYRVIKKGTDEDKRKIINKMCELFFTLNVKLYKEYMLKNEKVFENFYHMEYLIFPISIKEFTYKNKKIIIEYYLLGEKVYTDKKNFLYGVLYYSSNLFTNDLPFGYHGDLVVGRQSDYF